MSKHADELFPSEDETAVEKPKVEKRKSKSKPCIDDSLRKKTKSSSSSAAGTSSSKITAKQLFGTDSEDDDDDFVTQDVHSSEKRNIEKTEMFINSPEHEFTKKKAIMICEKCNIEIDQKLFKNHLKSNIHKSNSILKTKLPNIDIISTAFRNRIVTYKVNSADNVEYNLAEHFLNDIKHNVIHLLALSLKQHVCLKVNFELFAFYYLPKDDKLELKSFNLPFCSIFQNSNFDELYTNMISRFITKIIEFDHCESGWSFHSISHLEININKYSPMRGGTFLELPQFIKNTKCCLNIRNNDSFCLLWSIVAALFPCVRNVCRPSSYPHFKNVLNIEGMSFPPSSEDIKLLEYNNSDISINVYGIDEKRQLVIGPLYLTKEKKVNHVNLLYLDKNNQQHYCLIKDLENIIKRQITNHHGKIHLCERCLQVFSSIYKYKTHTCSKVVTLLPEKNTVLQFQNYERQQKIPFVIYADFESILLNNFENSGNNTFNYKKHQPSCFAYYICCSPDPTYNKLVKYRGSDCVTVFVKSLVKDIIRINNLLKQNNKMFLTTEQEKIYENATTCHICKKLLFDDKVADHDHFTSEFRGAAHSYCNLKFKKCPFVPVILHNLSNYDSHLFIEELVKHEGDLHVIPKSKEKYMTFTKFLKTKDNNSSVQIKFLDSFQFLSSSLDVLTKNLDDENFTHLSSFFCNKQEFDLLRCKGVYPYDYVNDWSKYEEAQLPSKERFYNSLNMNHISDAYYSHAVKVWNTFNINTLGEYTDLYLKCDVLLLCDVFESFRNMSLNYYNLDPAYYVSSPGLSWDAMLLYTEVKLDLISDLEMYQFLEKGIRGGLAQCSLRHATANHKYLPEYDNSLPSSYLIYLDANNLYGYAMSKKLPISEFNFMCFNEIEDFDVMTVPDDAEYGYILEVDLEYPVYLHDHHSDLPFAPEKFIPPGSKNPKLIANLYDKFDYVIHYVHLKECIKNGLVLKNVKRILKFRQDDYLKNYIDLNTQLRQAATSSFQKDFFKLLNNSIFGKTIQNRRKEVKVKLATTWNDNCNKTNKCVGAEKLIAKPNLKSVKIFSDNFVAIQLTKEKIILDRPIYIGFTVLEFSKVHLYKFHYNFIKQKYENNAKLCYTDTDSLLYTIQTNDVYEDIKSNLSLFDTSNFSIDNPYNLPRVNAKIPGLFKDELSGENIQEFVGLRAKLYCIKSRKNVVRKAKGVSKPVTARLGMSDYNKVLISGQQLRSKMNLIKSIKHIIYSQQVNKLVLCGNDDKRQILPDKIQTVPWGHYKYVF